MDKFDCFLVVILAILFCSFSYAVIKTAQDIREGVNDIVIKEREQKESRHLPTECRHLYDNGTSEEWMDCMGVGYVQSQ